MPWLCGRGGRRCRRSGARRRLLLDDEIDRDERLRPGGGCHEPDHRVERARVTVAHEVCGQGERHDGLAVARRDTIDAHRLDRNRPDLLVRDVDVERAVVGCALAGKVEALDLKGDLVTGRDRRGGVEDGDPVLDRARRERAVVSEPVDERVLVDEAGVPVVRSLEEGREVVGRAADVGDEERRRGDGVDLGQVDRLAVEEDARDAITLVPGRVVGVRDVLGQAQREVRAGRAVRLVLLLEDLLELRAGVVGGLTRMLPNGRTVAASAKVMSRPRRRLVGCFVKQQVRATPPGFMTAMSTPRSRPGGDERRRAYCCATRFDRADSRLRSSVPSRGDVGRDLADLVGGDGGCVRDGVVDDLAAAR